MADAADIFVEQLSAFRTKVVIRQTDPFAV